jgi:hypothetical protein
MTSENHIAMVENFVEKYLPIRIQTQLGECLRATMPFQVVEKLEEFDEKLMEKLHQTVI